MNVNPRWDRRMRVASALLACFCAGALTDGLLRVRMDRIRRDAAGSGLLEPKPVGTLGGPVSKNAPRASLTDAAPGYSRSGALRIPIDGVAFDALEGGFSERRGKRRHEAVDILAPRNTPVYAVDEGTIARLFVSKAGGNTVYQFDPDRKLVYYYAHLERYPGGLKEGDKVSRGDVVGYVGSSGNAPPNTPHLHFAVFELGGDRRWWQGKALDPYRVFTE